jgi:alpha-mannosidase
MNHRLPQLPGVPAILAAAVLASSLALPTRAAEPAPVKRIYIAPDDHTDYLWTLDEEGYRQAFVEMLDYYLDQIDATANNAPQYQARWNCDGSFWLWTYERNKPPQDFERLIARIRDGHISVPLTALASCYGGQPAEAVLRGMYYAGTLERR